ncbi:ATP-binding protein [bacterium]|nr:ATP-binding protein [bacterium]
MIQRLLQVPQGRDSVFLWGPRKTGKSYWLRQQALDGWYIDLLESDVYLDLLQSPHKLREQYLQKTPSPAWVIIDEVQFLPLLLNEVHWLIENAGARFLLTGSSARKLRRGQANLLGGRAWRREMKPLCLREIPLNVARLSEVMQSGLLPPHYLSLSPRELLRGYVQDYLKEEVAAEATTRKLQSFSTFLKVVGLTSCEILNAENVAREVGVSGKVVRGYFEILEDTLLASRLQPYRKSPTRRMSLSDKFYLFDVGLSNYLAGLSPQPGNPDFGKSFEHLIWMELTAYQAYRDPELEIRYWRTSGGLEVDFVLNDREAAIEVKSGKMHASDCRALAAIQQDGPVGRRLGVSLEKHSRRVQDVEILSLPDFLDWLWNRPPGGY